MGGALVNALDGPAVRCVARFPRARGCASVPVYTLDGVLAFEVGDEVYVPALDDLVRVLAITPRGYAVTMLVEDLDDDGGAE